MNKLHDILRSVESQANITLDGKQRNVAETAMYLFAKQKVNEYVTKDEKEALKEAIYLIPALWKRRFKLWLRKRSFIHAKKEAMTLAKIEKRPFYVIRASETRYVVQSTLEARTLKKRGIYKKNATAIKLTETADFVAYPNLF